MVSIQDHIEDKTVVVTGAVGSIGSALVRKVLEYNPKQLRALDQDETGLVFLADSLDHPDNFRTLVGNVRDYPRIKRALEGVDIVIHTAAMKHVEISEYNPFEAVLTNVMGVQNIIEASLKNNVEKVLLTSTDKAAAPTNTMGATKLLAEKMITAANYSRGRARTTLASVRFGNVMGTRGSVIPRILERLKLKLPILITDPNMTRYMMTEEDSVRLILHALSEQIGGETFVLKMMAVRLSDVISVVMDWFCEKYGYTTSVKEIGLFPGEKTYEELVSLDDAAITLDLEEMLIVLPGIRSLKKRILGKYGEETLGLKRPYRSDKEDPLPKDKLVPLIHKILENYS